MDDELVQPVEPETESLADPELADPDLDESAANYDADEEDE